MLNRILKQSVFLLVATIVIFSGCEKEEVVEEVENLKKSEATIEEIQKNENVEKDENAEFVESGGGQEIQELCDECTVETVTVLTGGTTGKEKKRKLAQYAKEGKIKEWEELTGEKFTLYNFVYLDIKVKGYIVKEKVESWGMRRL